ncbi:MAG: DUF134 domain-containing protein [Candidatus Omnitrophota bacterium]
MVRPKQCRLIAQHPNAVYYKPRGVPVRELEEEILSLDELEAMRLCDLEGLYHEAAAERMGISRATFGRIVEAARRKVTSALIHGKALCIEGGIVKMTNQRKFQCADCSHEWDAAFGTGRPDVCPKCGSANLHRMADEDSSGPAGGAGMGRGRGQGGGQGQGRGQGRGQGQGRGRGCGRQGGRGQGPKTQPSAPTTES